MTNDPTAVFDSALSLSETQRAELAVKLLDSLDQARPSVRDEATYWAAEVQRRSDELDSGVVQASPWEAVRGRLRSRLADGS